MFGYNIKKLIKVSNEVYRRGGYYPPDGYKKEATKGRPYGIIVYNNSATLSPIC